MDILIADKSYNEANRLKGFLENYGRCEIATLEEDFVDILLNNKCNHKFDCVFINVDFGEINAFLTLNSIRRSNEIILEQLKIFVIVNSIITLSILKFYEKNNVKFLQKLENEDDIPKCCYDIAKK